MPSRAALAGLAASVLGLAASRPCSAAGPLEPRFNVTRLLGAEDCPDADALTAASKRTALTGTPAPGDGEAADAAETPEDEAPPRPPTAVDFDVMFSRRKTAYVATVRRHLLGGERTITSETSCGALADALAVSVAVMLDSMPEAPVAPSPPRHVEPASRSSRPSADGPGTVPPFDAYEDNRPRTARNVVFAEILGSGLGYTINYERFFTDDASVRVGFGYVRENDWPSASGASDAPHLAQISIPLLVNYYSTGGKGHCFHVAGGATILYRTGPLDSQWYDVYDSAYGAGTANPGVDVVGNAVIGYRFLPRAGGLALGVDLMLLFGSRGLLPWVGVNAGAAF